MRAETRRRLKHALTLLLGLAVVTGLVAHVGIAAVVNAFRRADPLLLVLATAAYAAFFVLRGVRWRTLLRPVAPGASLTATSSLTAMGWLISTFVPMKAGDVTRTAWLAKRENAKVAGTAGTVAVERALDVLGIAAAASVGLYIAAQHLHGALPPAMGRAVALAWAVPLVGFAGLAAFGRFFLDPGADPEQEGRVKRIARDLILAGRSLGARPPVLGGVVVQTLLVTAAQMAVFVLLFLALEPAADVLLIVAGVPLFLLSFIVSVTPGNVGTYEAAFVAVYALLGFGTDMLIPLAIAIHLLTMLMVTVLGAAAFLVLRLDKPSGTPNPAPEVGE